MNVLINHTLRSIKSNLGQFVVIVLTVTIVTALLFAAITISGLFYNVNKSVQSRLGVDTDISLNGEIFSTALLSDFITENGQVEYADIYLQTGGIYKADTGASKVVLVEATDLETISTRHRRFFDIAESYPYSYANPAVWIGQSFAEENGISAGDIIELEFATGGIEKLTVTYIFKNTGFFANNVVDNVFIDISSAGSHGLANQAYLKLKDGADYDSVAAALSAYMSNDKLVVEPSINYERIERIVSQNQSLLTVALLFVIALMLFILFTSYLVISKNRINELVIFKAVGATNAQSAGLLMTEAMVYGFIGAFIGTILGRFAMGLAVSIVIPSFPDAVQFEVWHYIFSFAIGVLVSVAAAIIPFLRASKETIRDLTSGSVKESRRAPLWFVICGAVIFLACIIVILTVKSMPTAVAAVIIILSVVIAVMVIPHIVDLVSMLFNRAKGVAKLSSSSVRRNTFTHMLSGLVAAVIIFTFIIVSVINVVITAIIPFNERFDADFVIETAGENTLNSRLSDIKSTYGVKDAYYYGFDTFVWGDGSGGQNDEYTVYTVSDNAAIDLISNGVTDETKKTFTETQKAVIVSYDIMQRYGVQTGEKIRLKMLSGEYLDGEFTVVGTDFSMTSNDRVMIVKDYDYISGKLEITAEKGIIFILTDKDVPSEYLFNELREYLSGSLDYILRFENWVHATSVGFIGIITLLRLLQVLISAVAFIGIINLTIITNISRAREFNIYRASGLSANGRMLLSICEGFIIAFSGGIAGFLISLMINRLMPVFAKMINRYVVLSMVPATIPLVIGIACAVFIGMYLLVAAARRNKVIERNTL